MSGAIGSAAPGIYGILSTLVANSASVKQRLDTLTEQASTGRVADAYAGLGQGASVSLRLRPILAHEQVWQDGIDSALGRLQVTNTAMTAIQKVASDLYAQLNNLNGLSGQEVDSIAASARDALKQVAGLLDTKDGDTYVFAGQDSANAPVPNPDAILSSGFYTQISAAVGALATNGAASTAAATLAVASSNAPGSSPFSALLSQPASALAGQYASVVTGEGERTSVGLLASSNGYVASQGSSTTGSYMRDLLRSLATIGSLNSTQADAPGFADLVADTRTSLSGAISTMAADVGAMGNAGSRLSDQKATLADAATALSTQVSGAEDVDMAATLSSLSLVQTQLQSSYQLIANSQTLSLVKYLGSVS
ncbi:MAG: hypothetical protein JOY71_13360 [Acetobacteraceae bacterium]|nr:hypothetical protein [Acetobacteraceae bacterium]